jgi:hypothetical protein
MKRRLMALLPVYPCLLDHHFEGKAVLPTVESLILLACIVGDLHPRANLCYQADAQFPRLLAIDPEAEVMDLQVQLEESPAGIKASLWSSMKIRNSMMSRRFEHASVTFAHDDGFTQKARPFHEAVAPAGGCINIPCAVIYRELIPFGPSYQNITGDLAVSEDGALACIAGGAGEADDTILGSPFVLDASMHAACVWGQRFAGIVPFPTGIGRRIIHKITKKGKTYLARIVLVRVDDGELLFDVWIFEPYGVLCESITGLHMRDITQGRMSQPPGWVEEGAWKRS